ncbi:MAG: response regulator [Planctomycetales bacterium]|nr:response regulator [Planctomycetales bacterium]
MGKDIYRALIVDDEPLVRAATVRAMSATRFMCDSASDGREGLKKYRQHGHDLVVTDLHMPNKHGHSLIVDLFNESCPPHIVVLTGIADPRLVKDLLGRGVEDIVTKPVDCHVFASKMMSLFERGRWHAAPGQSNSVHISLSKDPLLAEIEDSIEIFSEFISGPLDHLLSHDIDSLSDPPSLAIEYIERLLAKRPHHPEQRNARRATLLTTVVAVPVDRFFQPLGEPFKTTSCDISQTGICLMDTRATRSEYLALRWRSSIVPSRFLSAVMRITRCKPLGPFYEIAGQFAMRDC